MAGYLTHRREPQCPLCAALRRQIPLEIMGSQARGWVINGIRARHGECANRHAKRGSAGAWRCPALVRQGARRFRFSDASIGASIGAMHCA